MPDPLSDVILKAYQPAATAPLNLFLLSSACQISRRVTFAAMRERFGDIRAPVPFWTLRRVGLKPPIFVEERRPETHQPALVERQWKRVLQGAACTAGKLNK